jgi:hypothetical protein
VSLRHEYPHLRCGICQAPFERGEKTVYLDDERCHRDCAQTERAGEPAIPHDDNEETA